jgi:hypothetical protein
LSLFLITQTSQHIQPQIDFIKLCIKYIWTYIYLNMYMLIYFSINLYKIISEL